MTRSFRSCNDEGLATVEFALVGGLLILLVTAIISFGGALAAKSALTSAVQDAARAASLPKGCNGDACTPNDMKIIVTNHTGAADVTYEAPTPTPCTWAADGSSSGNAKIVAKRSYPISVVGMTITNLPISAIGMMPCGS